MASSRPQNVGILAMDVYFPASCINQVRIPPHMLVLGLGEEHSEFVTILLFGYCVCVCVCIFGFVVFLFFLVLFFPIFWCGGERFMQATDEAFRSLLWLLLLLRHCVCGVLAVHTFDL